MGYYGGGDIIEITWSHPTLGNGRFIPKSGQASTYDPGGVRSDDSEDGIDVAGNMIDMMTTKRWTFEVENVGWDMINRQDIEAMTDLTGALALANWAFTNINGVIYSGNGKIVGDIKGNGKEATIPFKVQGGGVLTIQRV